MTDKNDSKNKTVIIISMVLGMIFGFFVVVYLLD
ncbi:MAG: preprotein translocase subunit SecE [Neolewinella sp.]|jgi:preprotein translocase subunit SecE